MGCHGWIAPLPSWIRQLVNLVCNLAMTGQDQLLHYILFHALCDGRGTPPRATVPSLPIAKPGREWGQGVAAVHTSIAKGRYSSGHDTGRSPNHKSDLKPQPLVLTNNHE